MEFPNWKLGDRIFGRNTGGPEPSTIIGLVPAFITPYINKDMLEWDELYPNWRDNYIAYSKFDSPQKPFSFDEFIKVFKYTEKFSNEELLEIYKRDVKEVLFVSYPVEDLI